MVRVIFISSFLVSIINFTEAQKLSVKICATELSNTRNEFLLVVAFENKSVQDLYLPSLGLERHLTLKGKHRGYLTAWCFHNRLECGSIQVTDSISESLYRREADSILMDSKFAEFQDQSFFFLKKGNVLRFDLRLCYFKGETGEFTLQYDNAKFVRCTHLNLKRYFKHQRRKIIIELPRSISGYQRFDGRLRSNKLLLDVGSNDGM